MFRGFSSSVFMKIRMISKSRSEHGTPGLKADSFCPYHDSYLGIECFLLLSWLKGERILLLQALWKQGW